ncbi:hypothetical protein FRB98_005935 [Tulasnella sp. 332]|nr:hypothetical protein FRB98_005935 [Tulasnella sp. 332]
MSTFQPQLYDQPQRSPTIYRSWPCSTSHESPKYSYSPEGYMAAGDVGDLSSSTSTSSASSTVSHVYPAQPALHPSNTQHDVPSSSNAVSSSPEQSSSFANHYFSEPCRTNSYDSSYDGRFQSFSSLASYTPSTGTTTHCQGPSTTAANSNPAASEQSHPYPDHRYTAPFSSAHDLRALGPAPPTSDSYEEHRVARYHPQIKQPHQYQYDQGHQVTTSADAADFLRFAAPPQPAGVFMAAVAGGHGYKKLLSATGGRVKPGPTHHQYIHHGHHPYEQTWRPGHGLSSSTSRPTTDVGMPMQSNYLSPKQGAAPYLEQYTQSQQRAGRFARTRITNRSGLGVGLDGEVNNGGTGVGESGQGGRLPAQGTQQGSWYPSSHPPPAVTSDYSSSGPATSMSSPVVCTPSAVQDGRTRDAIPLQAVQYTQQDSGGLIATSETAAVDGGCRAAGVRRQQPSQATQQGPSTYTSYSHFAPDEHEQGAAYTSTSPAGAGSNSWRNVNGIPNGEPTEAQGSHPQGSCPISIHASRNEQPPPPTNASYETPNNLPSFTRHYNQQPPSLPPTDPGSHQFNHHTTILNPPWQDQSQRSGPDDFYALHTDHLPVQASSSMVQTQSLSSSGSGSGSALAHHRHIHEGGVSAPRSDGTLASGGEGISRWEAVVAPPASSCVETGTTISSSTTTASSGNSSSLSEFSTPSHGLSHNHQTYVAPSDSSGLSYINRGEDSRESRRPQELQIPPSYHHQLTAPRVVPPPPSSYDSDLNPNVGGSRHHQSHNLPLLATQSYSSSSYQYRDSASSSSSVIRQPQYPPSYMSELPQKISASRHAAKSSVSSTVSTNTEASTSGAAGTTIQATSSVTSTNGSALLIEDGGPHHAGAGAARRRDSASSAHSAEGDAKVGGLTYRRSEDGKVPIATEEMNMIGDAAGTASVAPDGGSKIFECPGCDLTFTRLSALKQHMLSHTGEKPHSCQHCGRRFSLASNLRRHTSTGACKVLKFEAVKENAAGAISSTARASSPPIASSASQDSPVQPAALMSRRESIVEASSEAVSPKKDRKRKAPTDTKPAPRRKRHAHQEPRWIPRTLANFKNAAMLSSTPPFQFCIYRAKLSTSEDGSDAEDDKLEQFTTPTMPLHPVRPTPSRHRSVRSAASLSDSDDSSSDHEQVPFLGTSLVEDDYEERNSYEAAPEYPYHPANWKGKHARLPGPALLPDDELVKHPSVARRWIKFQR